MGSYGSLGSAAPYVQAGSEGAVGSIVGGSIDNIKDRKKKHYSEEDDDDNGRVYYYNGSKIDNRPYRPNRKSYK